MPAARGGYELASVARQMQTDTRRLLKSCYEKEYQPTESELATLVEGGYPIHTEQSISHQEAVERLLKVREKITIKEASDAFLASLGSQGIEYRTGLAPLAYSLHFPEHKYKKSPGSSKICAICGMNQSENFDLTEMAYRKYDWGNGMRSEPFTVAFDLEFFAQLPKVKPTSEDIELFRKVLSEIESANPNDTGRKIADRLKTVVTGNKYTRDYFFESLAVCGLLETPDFPGFDKKFMTIWKAQGGGSRPNKVVECDPPLSFWRAEHGINQESLSRFFPQI